MFPLLHIAVPCLTGGYFVYVNSCYNRCFLNTWTIEFKNSNAKGKQDNKTMYTSIDLCLIVLMDSVRSTCNYTSNVKCAK